MERHVARHAGKWKGMALHGMAWAWHGVTHMAWRGMMQHGVAC